MMAYCQKCHEAAGWTIDECKDKRSMIEGYSIIHAFSSRARKWSVPDIGDIPKDILDWRNSSITDKEKAVKLPEI